MPGHPSDHSAVHTVAVTVDDVVAAFEANRQRGAETVLRVTPPYSGRMRARLHRRDGVEEGPVVHLRPADLFDADAPDYPHPDETADRLREAPDVEYTRERHRRRHQEAVADWRAAVGDHVVDAAPLRSPDGTRAVDVVALG